MAVIEVIEGGPFTSVQDVPGRLGYWHVGVPPNGPMDDLAHRLANRVVANHTSAAALELTRHGPTLRFHEPATIAIGGARMPMLVDGRPVSQYDPIAVPAGGLVTIGASGGPGLRATLAVRGGIDVPAFLGSRSTFTLGGFGGLDGRILAAGDVLGVADDIDASADPAHLAPGMTPVLGHAWHIGVLVGPHTEPEFLSEGGVDALVRTTWVVHFNSARTGVRLIGPNPRWARADGGEAGLHPSNIHDTGYAIGSVDLTGDMPIILGPDGPSLGGFVCPLVVASAERWKLGQLGPGDRVRFVIWSPERAARAAAETTTWIGRATHRIDPLARPVWNQAHGHAPGAAGAYSPIIDRRPATATEPEVVYRRAGDRFVLVEYGPMALDLEIRLRVQALDRWVAAHLTDGVVDATPGVRSLLVQVDGVRLTVERAVDALRSAQDDVDDLIEAPFASRVVHLPLSWDDPATRDATDRYVHGVRSDAPWCPWNIEFIRRINGLESTEAVRRIVFDASYLVLGLGDVYLGAPVATPLDPRHRLVTTKYNPARTWTPENAVGIGGAYLCIYGMEGPGGYQFVGRTVQVWNSRQPGPHFAQPWLLRTFDQIRWFPVDADELMDLRQRQATGALEIAMEDTTFRIAEHRDFLTAHASGIDRFRATQQAAFAQERGRWEASGEFERVDG